MIPSNEALLLLDCCSTVLPPEKIGRIRQRITEGIDWSELIRLAVPHGLLPLVSCHLDQYASDLVPPLTLVQLSLYRRRVQHRNERQVAELVRIIELFRNHSIRALPFKGPALAIAAYGDLSLRESHDLDLWINSTELAAAGLLLREAGYRGIAHKAGVPFLLKKDEGTQQTEFQSDDGEVLIEIHGELQSKQFSFSPSFEEVWSRRSNIDLTGQSVAVFAASDLMITLAAHGSKHTWRRLSWIVDIAGMIANNPDLDWTDTLQKSSKWHARRRLLSATSLANTICGSYLPPLYEKQLQRTSALNLSNRRVRENIVEDIDARTIGNFLAELKHHCSNADSIAARLRITVSFMKKILSVDQSKMIRPMELNTLMLYKISRSMRGIVSSFVRPD